MLVRLKDRPAPIHPESEPVDAPFIIEKKTLVFEEEEEEYKKRGLVFAGESVMTCDVSCVICSLVVYC